MKNIVALGAFLAVGLALAIYGGVRVEHALASGGRPTAEGSVISSTTDSVSGRRGAANYEAKVSYRYQVDGKQYVSDVVSFRTGSGSRAEAQETVSRFAAGSKVPVHYQPSDPAVACLDVAGLGWRDAVISLVGLAITVAGAYGGFAAIRARSAKPVKKKKV